MYTTRVYRVHSDFGRNEIHWNYDIVEGNRPVAGGTGFKSEIDAYAACNQKMCDLLEERSIPVGSMKPPADFVRRFDGDPWGDRDQKWLTSGGALGSILIECNEGTGVRYMGARLIGKTGTRLYETDFPVPHRDCKEDLPKVAATMVDGLITAWYARQDF